MATKAATTKAATTKAATTKAAKKKAPAKKAPGKKAPVKKSTATQPAKKAATRKYSPSASKDVEREMQAMKQGKLRSGSGAKVIDPKQAIAIGLSEARRAGKKVPGAPQHG